MCLIDSDNIIHEWEVGGVPSEDPEIFKNLYEYLKERPWALDADIVVIERQPDKNKRMKSVENFLHTFFIVNEKETVLYHAKNKVPDVVGGGKRMYQKRKKVSIERCLEFLVNTNQHVSFFKKHDKKDDLADTVLQALAFMQHTETKPKEKKKTPRKPTENQSNTKYSKANLAWIYKQGLHLATKRFEKDLKRYYKSKDDLIHDFNLEV